jgi:hypothetical protein
MQGTMTKCLVPSRTVGLLPAFQFPCASRVAQQHQELIAFLTGLMRANACNGPVGSQHSWCVATVIDVTLRGCLPQGKKSTANEFWAHREVMDS